MRENGTIREAALQKQVNAFARGLGYRCHKWTRPARRGANDYFYTKFCQKIFYIEFKAYGEEPTQQQELEIKRLRDEGFSVFVVDSYEVGCACINEYFYAR